MVAHFIEDVQLSVFCCAVMVGHKSGIQCLSTGYYGFQKLSDFDATWESIENDRRKCAPIQLTWCECINGQRALVWLT